MLTKLAPIIHALAFLRRPLGLLCFGVGILGFILPILPGWPFIIPAIVLLGRRDRTLRHSHLLLRRMLRRMRGARPGWLREIGQRSSAEYLRAKHTVGPLIVAAERRFGSARITSP